MADARQSPIHMIVAYDFSESSKLALSRAIALAESEDRHILHIFTVLDEKHDLRPSGGGKFNYSDAAEVQKQLSDEIEGRLGQDAPSEKIHFFIHVHIGKPAEEILALAEEVGAHLILIGSRGRTGLKRVLMGSVSEKVVREALCPVLVVRERGYHDVELETIVKAPAEHAEQSTYLRPHRYAYHNRMIERQKSSWPWY